MMLMVYICTFHNVFMLKKDTTDKSWHIMVRLGKFVLNIIHLPAEDFASNSSNLTQCFELIRGISSLDF